MPIVDTPEPMASGEGNEPESHAVPQTTGAVTNTHYKTNVTTLTERIAIQLAADGAEHPVAAAVTIALRGIVRQERNEFAESLAIAMADLHALEAGTVPLAALPKALWALVHEHDLEPVLLVDLDHQLRGH
jgi:hypothetical protein